MQPPYLKPATCWLLHLAFQCVSQGAHKVLEIHSAWSSIRMFQAINSACFNSGVQVINRGGHRHSLRSVAHSTHCNAPFLRC